MELNSTKSKYMIFNFCSSLQFQTRIHMNDILLEQVKHAKFLGVFISDDLSWTKNTKNIINKAYKRMVILKKLYEFKISQQDLIHIYKL